MPAHKDINPFRIYNHIRRELHRVLSLFGKANFRGTAWSPMRPPTHLNPSPSCISPSMDDDGDQQGSAHAFFTVIIGLPLALWGGYTLIRDLLESNEAPARKPAVFRRRPRPKPAEPEPQAASNEPAGLDEPMEQEEAVQSEEVAADGGEDIGGSGLGWVRGTESPEEGAEQLTPDEEPEEPEIPVHPEILYAQSIVLSDPLPGAEPGPKNAFVIEATPVGLVAMGYDFKAKRWIYWANLTPHFRVLDAVARVYVNTHNRHDLYVPPAVADAANEAAEKEAVEGSGGVTPEQENGGSGGVTPEKIAEDSKASLFINPTPVGAAELPRPEKQHVANCFKRKGMLSELQFIPEGPREPPKRTSYADFLTKVNQPAKI